jgi:hypothetical protein
VQIDPFARIGKIALDVFLVPADHQEGEDQVSQSRNDHQWIMQLHVYIYFSGFVTIY